MDGIHRLAIGALLSSAIALSVLQPTTIHGATKSKVVFMNQWSSEAFGKQFMEELKAEFESLHPDLELVDLIVPYTELRTQSILRARAGSVPDVGVLDTQWVGDVVEAKALEPLNAYLTKDEIANIISPLHDRTYGGEIYAVPWFIGPIVLFVNKELVKKAGWDPPRGPRDLDEFKAMIEKVSALKKDQAGNPIYGFAVRTDPGVAPNTGFWFLTWLWAHGGDLVKEGDSKVILASDGSRAAIEFYAWMAKNKYTPLGINVYDGRTLFVQGRAGFLYDGPWFGGMARTLSKNEKIGEMYLTAKVPAGVTKENWGIANDQNIVMFRGSQNKKGAAALMKFLLGNRKMQERIFELANVLPSSRRNLTSSPVFKSSYVNAFLEQAPFTRGVAFKGPGHSAAMTVLTETLHKVFVGMDSREAMNEAARRIDDILKQVGKK